MTDALLMKLGFLNIDVMDRQEFSDHFNTSNKTIEQAKVMTFAINH